MFTEKSRCTTPYYSAWVGHHHDALKVFFNKEMHYFKLKIPQCSKQAGTKDCGIYAIAFAVAIVFGKNPATQNFKQDKMRAYLGDALEL